MKISLDWLKDYVNIPEDIELSKIAYDLTMSTVEVEDMTVLSREFENIIVGVVDEILPHPNADKLTICKTDIGGGEVREIVCGGINLFEGMKVAVAKPGAMVRWHGTGDPVEIKNTKLRGVDSYGMICASSEIGLFDLFPFTNEATIADLTGFEAPAGTNLTEALGIDDVILEIDNKSLTNRPDLWGHYGIAREIAALYDLPLRELKPFFPPLTPDFEITLDDTLRCPRYTGVKIEGLSTKQSPFEIQTRIWRVGMRPINAIVDITNYVMLATGQPTHAFDSDNIRGHIIVRRARDEEKLLLLNGRELSLTAEDLVIADEESAVGLAGVMGGEKDSVLSDTDKVILEIANFEPIGVRRTATRHELRTEAASRNEKGIDPERCEVALSLAMEMFAELFPGMSVTGFRDKYPEPLKRSEIGVSLGWLEKCLGKRIPDDDIAGMLARLGFDVEITGDSMRLTAPTWRSTGDVSIPNDIMEEVARMHGLENFEPTPITAVFTGAINQPDIDIDRRIREYLAYRCGMQEIYTYPWVSEEYLTAVLKDGGATQQDGGAAHCGSGGMLSISTPPSPEESYLRPSLLPNLCKAVAVNQHSFGEFSIFESAQVFFDRDFTSVHDPRESLPLQRRNAAGAFISGKGDVDSLFRKAKGIIEALPRYAHIEPLTFEKTEKPVWADDVLWLNIYCGGSGGSGSKCGNDSNAGNDSDGKASFSGGQVGNLALLSKKASLSCGIKNSAVMLFELDIDSLKPFLSRTNRFTHLPEYPMTDYDVSMVFDSAVKWGEISEVITGKKGPDDLLRDVSFVDEYRGSQVPDGKKSVTFRLVIGSLRKTLTSEEIEGCANSVVKRLKKNLGAELRGS